MTLPRTIENYLSGTLGFKYPFTIIDFLISSMRLVSGQYCLFEFPPPVPSDKIFLPICHYVTVTAFNVPLLATVTAQYYDSKSVSSFPLS